MPPKKKSYPLKRESQTSVVLSCGSLSFDTQTNQIWSNKAKGSAFVKANSHYRKLLVAFMSSQGKCFTYGELMSVLFRESDKGKPESATLQKKYVNDKVDALKKKLMKIEIQREELKQMFICDNGYRLVRPRVGRKQIPSKH